jgi:hypothetical protein
MSEDVLFRFIDAQFTRFSVTQKFSAGHIKAAQLEEKLTDRNNQLEEKISNVQQNVNNTVDSLNEKMYNIGSRQEAMVDALSKKPTKQELNVVVDALNRKSTKRDLNAIADETNKRIKREVQKLDDKFQAQHLRIMQGLELKNNSSQSSSVSSSTESVNVCDVFALQAPFLIR